MTASQMSFAVIEICKILLAIASLTLEWCPLMFEIYRILMLGLKFPLGLKSPLVYGDFAIFTRKGIARLITWWSDLLWMVFLALLLYFLILFLAFLNRTILLKMFCWSRMLLVSGSQSYSLMRKLMYPETIICRRVTFTYSTSISFTQKLVWFTHSVFSSIFLFSQMAMIQTQNPPDHHQ
jgi:hypothetical protein